MVLSKKVQVKKNKTEQGRSVIDLPLHETDLPLSLHETDLHEEEEKLTIQEGGSPVEKGEISMIGDDDWDDLDSGEDDEIEMDVALNPNDIFYRTCSIFCHQDGNFWATVEDFCDHIPVQNCQLIPEEYHEALNIEKPNMGYICESVITNEDGVETRKATHINMRFIKKHGKTEGHIMDLVPLDGPATAEQDPLRFHRFCSKNCNPYANFTDILEVDKFVEEYTKDHSLNILDVSETAVRRGDLCMGRYEKEIWKQQQDPMNMLWAASLPFLFR